MPRASFSKADIERALQAAVSSGVEVGEVRIDKTEDGTSIRILSRGLPDHPEGVNTHALDTPIPEPWA